jgi:hypothetical protein
LWCHAEPPIARRYDTAYAVASRLGGLDGLQPSKLCRVNPGYAKKIEQSTCREWPFALKDDKIVILLSIEDRSGRIQTTLEELHGSAEAQTAHDLFCRWPRLYWGIDRHDLSRAGNLLELGIALSCTGVCVLSAAGGITHAKSAEQTLA